MLLASENEYICAIPLGAGRKLNVHKSYILLLNVLFTFNLLPVFGEYFDCSKCDALHDLVPFVQFKKREKHPWRSVNFTKINTPPWVFLTFFKLYEWYQIVQRTTNFLRSFQGSWALRSFLMILSSGVILPLCFLRISSLASFNAASMAFYSIFIIIVSRYDALRDLVSFVRF